MKKFIALLALLGMVTAFAADAPTAEFTPSGYNSFSNGNTEKIYKKYVNYNEGGMWKKTELRPVDKGTYYEVATAPFGIVAPKTSAGIFTFTDKHNYSAKEQKIRTDAPVSKNRVFTGTKSVTGIVENHGVRYPGAFDTLGADLVLEMDTDEARYLVEWKALPTPCSNPSATFEVPFTQTFGGLKPTRTSGTLIKNSNVDVGDGFSVSVNSFRGIRTPQARIWDSKEKFQSISIIAKFDGTTLTGRKVIPCSFFSGVTYPVRTDDVDTFYPNPNVETVSVDGRVAYADVGTWATVHDAATGTDAFDAQATAITGSRKETDYAIHRFIMLFDTSAIPDANTISSATISLMAGTYEDTDDDGNAFVTVLSSNPASNTALVTADYDQVGSAITNPTKLSNDLDISAISTAVYNVFTLNAAGIAAISKTGVTKLGVREGHDQVNDPPGNTLLSTVTFLTADTALTTSDPVLTVTHSSGASSSSPVGAPIQMLLVFLNKIIPHADASL